ncbi:MAG TPA: alpha/beta hydrolase-fold protein [Bacteroidota bacterium]|nr:alpha/beta hydrolase-fold protein [Bacteroidota bacterium]
MPRHCLPCVALFAWMLTAPEAGCGELPAESFASFAARVASIADSALREREVDALVERVRASGVPLHDDSTVTFLYRGAGRRAFVAGDADGWDPRAGEMRRVGGTTLRALTWRLDGAARCEYKLVVDSSWILDPLNALRARGGFGENSEVRMPRYVFPAESVPRPRVRPTRLDTISFMSRKLQRRIPVIVYAPGGGSVPPFPVMFVTDGGEYLELAHANVVLDNLIAGGSLGGVVAVFVDPRDGAAGANSRMTEYALNDAYVSALADELRPLIRTRYRTRGDAAGTAIIGSSMGGLIATYAVLTRPDAFGLCGALSPSYQWDGDSVIAMIRNTPGGRTKFYLATGTIHDAGERSRRVRDLLKEKGYDVTYDEVPESHNWLNWTGRLRRLLTTFWGVR